MKNSKIDWIILSFIIIIQLAGLMVLAKSITQKTDQLIEKNHKLIALEQKDDSLVKLQKDYDLVKNDLEIIGLASLDKEKMIDFIAKLENEASASGVLAKISFSNQAVVAESPSIKSVNLTLNMKGTYYKIIDFIKKVEKMPQVVVVDSINIQSPIGIENENQAILSLKIYVDPKF